MKNLSSLIVATGLLVAGSASAADKVPAVFSPYLKLDALLKGEVIVVVPPSEISKFVAKVKDAADADPAWFKEYSKNSKPGVPLPFHEKLGLSQDDYAKYIKLWEERKMQPVPEGNVVVRLERAGEMWKIRVTGKGDTISNLKYDPATDVVKSPNGTLTRIPDIDADEKSILGKWTGHEWRFSEEDGLGKTKENFAIGKTGDNKYGLLVYRLQSSSATGRLLYDKSIVIRFPLPKG